MQGAGYSKGLYDTILVLVFRINILRPMVCSICRM
jgi:hypothetical protein